MCDALPKVVSEANGFVEAGRGEVDGSSGGVDCLALMRDAISSIVFADTRGFFEATRLIDMKFTEFEST